MTLNNANHRDLLSQGAKDFIARHAGDNVDALNELFAHAVQVTDTNSRCVAIQSSTSVLQLWWMCLRTDVNCHFSQLPSTWLLVHATGDMFTLTVKDHVGGSCCLTTGAGSAAAADMDDVTEMVAACSRR